ncbi:unnamed protein product [Bursaphelenchus xylophilus]|uniref:(pine wood nematode) hypothetical protein n=1 Tax=Bursaphelenchus xylophilus TaxID=6326 RepID=A0A7I8WNT6_BURXY|nr:unnamed protein product [Bursaphelenchus xylophilus]CAG9093713.1 unnamed protein product [Bursaphelenchus xylophilus]
MMMSNRPLKRRALNLLEPDHLLLDSMTPSTSSVESVGSTTVSSPGANSDGFQSACPICGDGAWNKHFGVLCCNACAAFFRRTVALRKTYLCVRGKRCDVVSGEPRHMCKFCRFQRCIWNGMCINSVFSRPSNQDDVEEIRERNLLQTLIHCRNATFVERFSANIKTNDGRQNDIAFGTRFYDAEHTVKASQSEFMVVLNYLKMAGFRRFGLDNLALTRLAVSLFYQWVCFTSITVTLRNGGHNINEVYFVDESHHPVNEATVHAYVKSFASVIGIPADSVDWTKPAEYCMEYYHYKLAAAKKLHMARLDDTELSVMLHIMAVKMAIRAFPENSQLNPHLNNVFEGLRSHYEANFDDVAVRMGNLILLINEIETVTFRLEELVVCLQNNGYRSILANLIHSKMLADQYRSSYGPYAQPDIAARSSSAPPAKLPKFPVDERQTHSEDIKMEINYDSNQNIDVVSV